MSSNKISVPGRFVAEFSVVVLGVIVALGVDEWRRTLSDRAEESLYYERLAQDMAADVATWELLLQQLEPKDDALARVEQWSQAGTVSDVRSLRMVAEDLAMGAVYSGSVPPPRRSTYEELLSTGKLDLIRDPEFRAALLEYHFSFDNLMPRLSSRTTGYERLAYALVPREIRGTGDNFARSDLSESELRTLARRVAATDELQPMIIAERNRTAFLRGQFEDLVKRAEVLMKQAEAHPTGPSEGR